MTGLLGRALRWALVPGLVFLAACELLPPVAGPAKQAPAEAGRLNLTQIRFQDLPGWAGEDHAEALPSFLRSCAVFDKMGAKTPLGDIDRFGVYGDWQEVCKDARLIRPGNKVEAKYFWESRFIPYSAHNGSEPNGLFTGYFEPELEGRWAADAKYRYPIMSRPGDLIAVDLGKHRDEWKGEHLAGRIVDNNLLPYFSRGDIERGALAGRGLEILWVSDQIGLFFLHVQGSGRVRLQDGSTVRVGYAGRNGRRYTAIGRELVARGVMKLEDVTAPAIADWLRANPVQGQVVMEKNQSYVFFRVVEGDGPLGALGIPLTPGRSLAVDRAFVPLGIPIWLVAADPLDKKKDYRHIMMAHDTGSAIKGPVRGDVFWGHGEEAGRRAGVMKSTGRYYFLLPRTAAPAPIPN